MGTVFFKTANVSPTAQFLGTEFSAAPSRPRDRILKVREIYPKMGPEAKDFSIEKVFTQDGVTVRSLINGGTASNTEDVAITGTDADILLLAGEQIQFVTTSATAAMQARVLYEELDNGQEPGLRDPKVTR